MTWRVLLHLNQNGIYGNPLKLLWDFHSCRKQEVVLNAQHNVTAGVPQGSILLPLWFVIYINDLSNDISSK